MNWFLEKYAKLQCLFESSLRKKTGKGKNSEMSRFFRQNRHHFLVSEKPKSVGQKSAEMDDDMLLARSSMKLLFVNSSLIIDFFTT